MACGWIVTDCLCFALFEVFSWGHPGDPLPLELIQLAARLGQIIIKGFHCDQSNIASALRVIKLGKIDNRIACSNYGYFEFERDSSQSISIGIH